MSNEIRPLEEIEPEIAGFIKGIVNKQKPYGVKSMSVSKDGVYIKTDTIIKAEKISRNDPCPCGSNKKYKKCCGK